MTRFVILHHCLPPGGERQSHWDLMIECDGELLTWALDEYPTLNSWIGANELANHRIDYLEYEGPVSGGRGEVRRVESGWSTMLYRDAQQLSAELRGESLQCIVNVSRETSDRDKIQNPSHVNSGVRPGDQRCTAAFMPLSNPPNSR